MIPSSNRNALESPECVTEVADCFDQIASAMHGALLRLSGRPPATTEKVYALITEEYGLRARLGILRGDAVNRVVQGVSMTQSDLVHVLSLSAQRVSCSQSLDEIASITNTAAVLCVSIYPGKQRTVDFLISVLRLEVAA